MKLKVGCIYSNKKVPHERIKIVKKLVLYISEDGLEYLENGSLQSDPKSKIFKLLKTTTKEINERLKKSEAACKKYLERNET